MTFYLKSICIVILVSIAGLLFTQSQSQHSPHEHQHHHQHQHHDHSDDEEHVSETPSFKYSREANIKASHEDIGQSSDAFGHHSHHSHQHKHDYHSHESEVKKEVSSVWVSALGSTLLISLAPYIILFFIPLDNSPKYESWLKVLLAFASGGLLGDAFLHLIPHAMMAESGGDSHAHHHHNHAHSHSSSHTHSHSHSDNTSDESEPHSHSLSVGLWVLAGIIVFLMVEKFVRIVNGGQHSHTHSGIDSHKHSTQTSNDLDNKAEQSRTESNVLNSDDKQQTDTKDAQTSSEVSTEDENEENRRSENDKSESELSSDNVANIQRHRSDSSSSNTVVGNIKIAGYLNLAADFTHNLTDGLAIGASFLAGKNIGIVTTITILLHEIPHEIGDFAILIQSGCSRQKAMQLQLITAVGAFTGTAISLFTEGLGDSASSWILPFTAGGFIYIATVSVIPELLENNKFWQSIKELSALLIGITMMVIIAQYE